LLVAGPASAQPPPDYGHQFATITHPGNRNAAGAELQYLPDLVVGQVNYEYRIAKNETTIAQWIEFGNAYLATHPEAPAIDTELIGATLSSRNRVLFSPALDPQATQGPMKMSWRMAARYANWLHNDKAMTREAFDSGAYDVSTFTRNADGSYNDQLSRSPGARFWLPTRNEWVKATFYDPNRYGEGQEGYWRASNGTDTLPISGLPSQGGQTSAGIGVPWSIGGLPVGAYPNVRTPWGLLDVSGGVSEWSESGFSSTRFSMGSELRNSSYHEIDRPDPFFLGNWPPTSAEYAGFRIASIVPAPSTALYVLLSLVSFQGRSRLTF
jgi:formylglycine-generating enzyme required for sulfatase activity